MARRRHRPGNLQKSKRRTTGGPAFRRGVTSDGTLKKAGIRRKRGGKADGMRPRQRADKPRRGTTGGRSVTAHKREVPEGVSAGPRAYQDGGSAYMPPTAQAGHVDADGRVVIDNSDWSTELREGGSRSWRNNNPGNMAMGPWTAATGAIGANGQSAIFPDAGTGIRSMRNRLASPDWSGNTLREAIARWAPRSVGNDPDAYASFVSRATNVPVNTKLSALTDDQLDDIVSAMTRFEGWQPGKATTVYPP